MLNGKISQIVSFTGKPLGFLLFGENFWVNLNFGMRPLLVEYGKIKMKKCSFLGAKNDHFWSFFPILTRRKAEFNV